MILNSKFVQNLGMKIIGQEEIDFEFLEFRKKYPLPQHNCPNNLGQSKSVLIYFLISVIGHNGDNQNLATFVCIKNDFVQVI